MTLSSQSINSGVGSGETVNDGANVEVGLLTFVINDGFDDGICCSYGQGGYGVNVDGDLVGTGGDFWSSSGVTFAIGVESFTTNDIAGSTGRVRKFAMVSPPGASSVACAIAGDNGDADLYVSIDKANVIGEDSSADCSTCGSIMHT